MPPLYSYPSNYKHKVLYGDRLHNYTGPTMTGKETEEIADAERKLVARIPTRDRHYSQGHIKNVAKYLPYVRLGQRWQRRRYRRKHKLLRRIPKKVLKTISALNLK